MSQVIRVLLVDDHTMVREMLQNQLAQEADFKVIGSAPNAEEAVQLCRVTAPDVVVMDIDMPGELCFAVARQIKTSYPETRILYLSAFSNDRYIEDALAAGASGYVTKDEPIGTIIRAIRMAGSGIAYFSPKIQSRIVVEAKGMRLGQESRSRASLLTQRELETVRYIARGLSKKEIAGLMHVSVKTVDMHTQNAMGKLDIHDRVELARFAIREGLAEA